MANEFPREDGDCLMLPHKLCHNCKAFTEQATILHMSKDSWNSLHENVIRDEVQHCSGIEELESHSENGCHLCTLLYSSIREATKSECQESTLARQRACSLRLTRHPPGGAFTLNLVFQPQGTAQRSVERDLEIDNRSFVSTNVKSQFSDAQFSCSTRSEGSIRLIRNWLSECLAHHSVCSDSSSKLGQLPTRLIDVNTLSDPALVRLYSTSTADTELEYLTLSHCWGRLEVLKLEGHNIEAMMAGFQISELPRTFQDAIEITRRLGYQYLWIDAMCIIQDSVDDWSFEALRMAAVYENGVCNIAALGAVNGHGGCFATRRPLEHYSCRLVENNDMDIYATSMETYQGLLSESDPESNAPGAIHTRAWIVQERLMSPRNVYFGSRIIRWECRSKMSKDNSPEEELENHPINDRLALRGKMSKKQFAALRQPLNPTTCTTDCETFNAAWGDFVALYTRCALTQDKDKFFAAAGMVEIVQRSTGMTNISGLWEELLPTQLLWRRTFINKDKDELVTQPLYQRAPSWSWVSRDGPISLHGQFETSHVLKKVQYQRPPGTHDCFRLTYGQLCIIGEVFQIEKPKIYGKISLPYLLSEGPYSISFHPDEPLRVQSLLQSPLFFLIVSRKEKDMRRNTASGVIGEAGIVLTKSPTGRSFHRVGFFEYHYSSSARTPLLERKTFSLFDGSHQMELIVE